MFGGQCRYISIICFLLIGIHGFTSILSGAEIDRKNPVAVANAFLEAVHNNDYNTIITLMSSEQRKEYETIMKRSPEDIEKIFSKDKKKAGKVKQVTELRKITTFSGKPGIAAKVKKKGRETFVIILSQEGDEYFYENSLTVTSKLYKQLAFIQKVSE